MRRHHPLLLSVWLLACGTAPLAAIEYHSQADAANAAADPLEVVQGAPHDEAGVPAGDPSMIGGFCDDCCDSCCDKCCDWCDGLYIPHSWIVRADVLWMDRQRPNDNVVLTDANGVVRDASQIQFQYEAGFDLSLMQCEPDGKATEFRYLWINDFTETQNVLTLDPVLVTNPVTNDPIAGPTAVGIEYNNQLKGMELHRIYALRYGSLLVGARYFDLDEQLGFQFLEVNAAPDFSQSTFNTRNDLIGLQIGYGAQVYEHDHWNVQVLGKAGVYHNDVDSDVLYVSTFGVNNVGEDSSDELAVASEFRLTATYQFAPGWAVRMGYQVLFFDGVALASEQIATTGDVFANDPIPTEINLGTVYYHGGFAGLEYNF